jgi:hypothetical protein
MQTRGQQRRRALEAFARNARHLGAALFLVLGAGGRPPRGLRAAWQALRCACASAASASARPRPSRHWFRRRPALRRAVRAPARPLRSRAISDRRLGGDDIAFLGDFLKAAGHFRKAAGGVAGAGLPGCRCRRAECCSVRAPRPAPDHARRGVGCGRLQAHCRAASWRACAAASWARPVAGSGRAARRASAAGARQGCLALLGQIGAAAASSARRASGRGARRGLGLIERAQGGALGILAGAATRVRRRSSAACKAAARTGDGGLPGLRLGQRCAGRAVQRRVRSKPVFGFQPRCFGGAFAPRRRSRPSGAARRRGDEPFARVRARGHRRHLRHGPARAAGEFGGQWAHVRQGCPQPARAGPPRSRTGHRASAGAAPSGALASRPSTAASARSYPGAARTASIAAGRPCRLPAWRAHRGRARRAACRVRSRRVRPLRGGELDSAASRAACKLALRACWASSAVRAGEFSGSRHRGPPRLRTRASGSPSGQAVRQQFGKSAARASSIEPGEPGRAADSVRLRRRAIRLRSRLAALAWPGQFRAARGPVGIGRARRPGQWRACLVPRGSFAAPSASSRSSRAQRFGGIVGQAVGIAAIFLQPLALAIKIGEPLLGGFELAG